MSFAYHQQEYDARTIENFAESYREYMNKILEHCSAKKEREFTPSDFGDQDLSLEDLD